MKLFFFISIIILQSLAISGQHNDSVNISNSFAETTCPYLTKNAKGQTILSWVSSDSLDSRLCYGTFNESGLYLTDTMVVNVSKGLAPHGENLPKLAFKPNGEIVAIWGTKNSHPKNKYAGLIFFSHSFDNGMKWTSPTLLNKDSKSHDQRYFDIGILPNGEACVIWLDNPNNARKEGSNLYYSYTTGNNAFTKKILIEESTCQCCRTKLLTARDGSIHIAYRDIINDSIRDMVYSNSIDGGKSFTKGLRISVDNWKILGCPHTGPSMAITDKALHVVWYTQGGQEGVYYTRSDNYGKHFDKRQILSPIGRHPQIAALSNGTIGMVWEETENDGENYISRIVLKVLKPDGKYEIFKISPENKNGYYPVITEFNTDKLMLAWVEESMNEKEVDGKNNQKFSKNRKSVVFKTIELKQ